MAVVAGRNRTNRPFFFTGVDGERVEFPSHGEGIGELDGAELNRLNELVSSGQIELIATPVQDDTTPVQDDTKKPKRKAVKNG